jgi:Abortive infection alpha
MENEPSKDKDDNVTGMVKAAAELAKQIPVYEDALQPLSKETGKALGTVGRAVNAVLLPVRGLIWSVEQVGEFIESSVSQKLEEVPVENICSPDPSIIVPAFEALRYRGHEEELREMYATLLASALNIDTKDDVHPSFVEVIKQLTPDEAKLLSFLSNLKSYPEICSINDRRSVAGGREGDRERGVSSNQIKMEFLDVCFWFENKVKLKSALDNFLRLQLLEIETKSLNRIKESWPPKSLLEINELSEALELEVIYNEKLTFSSLGISFVQSCVKAK